MTNGIGPKTRLLSLQPLVCNGGTQALHQPLVEPKVVLRHEHRAENLGRFDEVMHVGPAEGCAGGARTPRFDRLLVFGEARVPEVYRSVAVNACPVRPDASAARNRTCRSRARPPQRCRPASRRPSGNAACPPAASRPRNRGSRASLPAPRPPRARRPRNHRSRFDQRIGGRLAQPLVERALLDAEIAARSACSPPRSNSSRDALRPADRALHRLALRLGRVDVVGTSWSNCMRMSLSNDRCTSIDRSGDSMCRDPSRWLAKATPSSVTFVSADRLITW